MSNIVYERMTDEMIIQLSEDRVITSDGDFNLKRGTKYEKNRLYPVIGGVYDSDYFGSIYTDTCNCGRYNVVGRVCHHCGSRILTEEEKYRRYARIDLPVYYIMDIKIEGLLNLLYDLPLDYKEASDFFEFKQISMSSAKYLTELCQFEYVEETGEISVSPYITQESHASLEGLLRVLEEHFPDKVEDLKSLMNKELLVTPAAYRMASFNPYDPETHLSIPMMSALYSSVVTMKNQLNEYLASGWEAGDGEYEPYTDPAERVAIKAMFRRYCAKIPTIISDALQPSKENIFRTVFSARLDDSGRAVIVPDPDLEIDEVLLPINLAYELLKTDFIIYLSEKLQITEDKAETKYLKADKETLDIFREYCPRRRVIMNRPPSLHRYNNMCYRFRVTEDQAIHFPITAVEPFAADFDGDAMMFFLIPEHLNELCDKNASPKTQLRYESDGGFIWKPNQDMLYGLTLATRINPPEDLDQGSLPHYTDLSDAEKDFEDQKLMYPTDYILMGTTPRLTTLAREEVGKIIRRPVNDLYGPGGISSDNIKILLAYLYQLPDFTTVYRDLIKYALEVLTLEGATVPSMVDMISFDSTQFNERMQELIKLSATDPKYHRILEDEYAKSVEETVNHLSADLLRRVNDSGRMKISQVKEMLHPQMIIDQNGDYFVATNSLRNGLSYEDYIHHAVNNRILLQMKQEITPQSGYTNRQLIMAGQGTRINRERENVDLEGIYLPRNRAEGRTTMDGEVLGKSDSDEMVLVKSFATARNEVLTPEIISEVVQAFEDKSNVGLRFTSSVSGTITQGGLSLKHTGHVLSLDPHLELKARFDCSVRRISLDTIEISATDGSKKILHYIPSDFILMKSDFKTGEVIGFRDKFIDPGYKATTIINLVGALNTNDIGGKGTPKDMALCVSPVGGRIHYDNEYVHIGHVSIPRDPDRVYYYFEGEEIKPYTLICDGTLDCANIVNYCPHIRDYYGCFRTFFYTLLPNLQEHIVEYVFRLINTYEDGVPTYVGIKDKVREDKSFLTNLGYEGATRMIRGMLGSEKVIEDKTDTDLFHNYYLTLLQDHL